MSRSLPTRPRTGVAARLVVLVLVPVIAMGVTVSRLTVEYRHRAVASAHLEKQVPAVERLLRLRGALHAEEIAVGVAARAHAFGMEPPQIAKVLGLPQARISMTGTRHATDNVIAALGPVSPVSPATMWQLRARLDRGGVDPADAIQLFADVDRTLDGALAALFDHLEDDAHAVLGGGTLSRDLTMLRASTDALGFGAAQATDAPDLTIDGAHAKREEYVRLGRDTGRYEEAMSALAGSTLPPVQSTLRSLATNRDVAAFEQAVTALSRGEAPAGGIAGVLVSSRGALVRDAALSALVPEVAAALERQAEHLRDVATNTYRMWLWQAAVIAALVIAVALVLARSIIRPLRKLASSARRVGSGQLDVEPVTARGPRETRSVADAFNDLVSNLRVLEAKSAALARCDFDDPVLETRVPGALGESLERSVTVLSGSLDARKELQSRLQFVANHDVLTGLANRAAALEALRLAIAREKSSGAMTAAVFAHLHGLKRIHDTFGHATHDELLRVISRRLRGVARAGDVVSRLGTDDFFLVAENVRTVDEAGWLAKRVVAAISEPATVNGSRMSVGATAGVAFSRDGNIAPDELLQCADIAAYTAAERGTSPVSFYDDALQEELARRADVEDALADALTDDSNELCLYYQPIVRGRGARLVAAEALIRWQRPGVGLVPPNDFIPIAEASDLIIDVDRWVLRAATRQLARWADDPALAGMSLSINVSGRHLLDANFVAHVAEVLDGTVDPKRVIIEVTESLLVTDLATAAAHLEEIRRLGVRVAIDDFGTGYTSLAHLRRFPVDEIKIDRSLVSHPDDASDERMIRIVNDLADHLSAPTVAEGVETEEQLEGLLRLGCDTFQGFLFSRPLPPDAFVEWARSRRASSSHAGSS